MDMNNPATFNARRLRVTFNEVTQQYDVQELPKRAEDQTLSKYPVVEVVVPDVPVQVVPVVKQEEAE
ncbi:MAG: hypothetical protein LC130_23170 [Bryobacterales bacterium]|nr:hypothetical protein [Bryobacterales bacterium]MCZ2077891.1 hypothetical protein [Bryobacterales bacterium]